MLQRTMLRRTGISTHCSLTIKEEVEEGQCLSPTAYNAEGEHFDQCSSSHTILMGDSNQYSQPAYNSEVAEEEQCSTPTYNIEEEVGQCSLSNYE